MMSCCATQLLLASFDLCFGCHNQIDDLRNCLCLVCVQDWEPLSLQQKQAASAVEVFRIIEEVSLLSYVFYTLSTMHDVGDNK